MSIPALFLMGPTASGKTGLALALARYVAEGRTPWRAVRLISVDSAQIYRGMDIGSAKPSPDLLAQWPHALIDILDPAEPYSAARFRDDAWPLITAARTAGELPVLVGGTGLYFRALEQGLSEMPAADETVRAALKAEAAREGWDRLHERLRAQDPAAADKIKPNDRQRLLRALEITALTGETRSAHWKKSKSPALPGPLVKVALMPPERAMLHAVIAERFHAMMAVGFLDEVRHLKARADLHLGLPSMRAVGYRQLWEHLDGECGLDEAVERGIVATRQYAKRQLTWLRGEPSVHWLDPHQPSVLENLLQRFHSVAE